MAKKIKEAMIEDMEKKFMEIAKKYSQFEFLFVVRVEDSNEVYITGNACAVCAAETLLQFHQDGQLKHIVQADKEDNEKVH